MSQELKKERTKKGRSKITAVSIENVSLEKSNWIREAALFNSYGDIFSASYFGKFFHFPQTA
jgi:hypothetical protein